jgi:hypothetical protein
MNYPQLLALFKETHLELQQRAARSVDTSLVIRNWLFGWYIVEFEQGGAERAELYGKSLINRLSSELKSFGLKVYLRPASNSAGSFTWLTKRLVRRCLTNLLMLGLPCWRFNWRSPLYLLMPLSMLQKCFGISPQHWQVASLSDGRITLLC